MTIASISSSSEENKENMFEEQTGTDLSSDDERPPFHFEFPEVLKSIVERDNSFVHKKKHLILLPVNPNVITILEGYVKNFAVNILCSSPTRSKLAIKPVLLPERNIDLCKEIMCDLRLMFDFILSSHLLYANEREQYEQVMESYTPPEKIEDTPMPSPVKVETVSPVKSDQSDDETKTKEIQDELPAPPVPPPRRHRGQSKTATAAVESNSESRELRERKSPTKNVKQQKNQKDNKKEVQVQVEENESPDKRVTRSNLRDDPPPSPEKRVTRGDSKDEPPTKRRTRSSSTVTEEKKPEEPQTQASPQMRRRSRTTTAKDWKATEVKQPQPGPAETAKPVVTTPPQKTSVQEEVTKSNVAFSPPKLRSMATTSGDCEHTSVFQGCEVMDIMRWKIIPTELYHQKPPLPSMIYGAPHLLRLFTKIPDFVSLMPMPDERRNVLAKHFELFLAYLKDRRDDLFPDSAYEGHSDVRTRRH